jgi:hypothetical protein
MDIKLCDTHEDASSYGRRIWITQAGEDHSNLINWTNTFTQVYAGLGCFPTLVRVGGLHGQMCLYLHGSDFQCYMLREWIDRMRGSENYITDSRLYTSAEKNIRSYNIGYAIKIAKSNITEQGLRFHIDTTSWQTMPGQMDPETKQLFCMYEINRIVDYLMKAAHSDFHRRRF